MGSSSGLSGVEPGGGGGGVVWAMRRPAVGKVNVFPPALLHQPVHQLPTAHVALAETRVCVGCENMHQ